MKDLEVRQALQALSDTSKVLDANDRIEPHLSAASHALDLGRTFAAHSKLANTAKSLLDDTDLGPLQQALSSIAVLSYQYCVDNSDGRSDFSPSLTAVVELADRLGGVLPTDEALQQVSTILAAASTSPSPSGSTSGPSMPPAAVSNQPEPSSDHQATFMEAVKFSVGQRLDECLKTWTAAQPSKVDDPNAGHFKSRIARLIAAGEEGRSFSAFALLDEDLDSLIPQLADLDVPSRPKALLQRAQSCRLLAVIDFRTADESDFATSRRAWLLAGFWNSCLAELWATNEEQVVYDFLGYLTAIQAEHRYTTHDDHILLLLRVSHLICRIASNEEHISTPFYSFGYLETWVRFTLGTVLAISGPGRVPPYRVRSDSRLVRSDGTHLDRADYAAKLLPTWRAPEHREAACALLLELGSWNVASASRLVQSALKTQQAEVELWTTALRDVVNRASQVRVLRPNPWAETTQGKLITADTNALAVLASDVIHRTFPSLGGAISLDGTSFRDRRVPTFVCSADFGPLGLFKADARTRIMRESESFTTYAQRLHPRYRASRCDRSVATISEPDDRIEFVAGLLTSYVFTENEAPRSLTSWLQAASLDDAVKVVRELFAEALKPWYRHGTLGTVDLLEEYPLFSRAGLDRLRTGLDARSDLPSGLNFAAIEWIASLVDWINGKDAADTATQSQAARLQLTETLRSIIHGDLHLDNVMVLGTPGSEYPCLIDFETTTTGHLLRDLGRFVGALLFRVHTWEKDEQEILRQTFLQQAIEGRGDLEAVRSEETRRLNAVLSLIRVTWESYVSYGRSGLTPGHLEVVASLVCSFLPYARYPDTSPANAGLALDMSADLVKTL